MITEELIEATWHSTKSIAEIAKKFKVKPAEVRQAFDIALSRRAKTSDAELTAKREHINEISRESQKRRREKLREYERKYRERNREKINAQHRENYHKRKEREACE